ncbi:MAG TPA: sigma-54 dependent transcriptional regulator [Planctomycetota bacterium]|nr:sigma-54 dependent transcriptional regulator [Planctomycetota bacterium]
MPHALVMDDDPISVQCISQLLKDEGFDVSSAAKVEEARTILQAKAADVLLLDLVLPDGSGLEILKELDSRSDTQVVVITGHASVETVTQALRLGAADYLTKPIDVGRLKAVLANLLRTLDLDREIDTLREQLRDLGQYGQLLGASSAMQQVYDLINRVAPTDASVFISGESGTGKDLAAQAIHQFSGRRKEPFFAVNCGAISPNLIESELFGHEKGSFTGADRLHRGHFERANGSTLFLDEITEMPIELQVKLLRVLETSSAIRLGGDQPIPLNVRVIAATNRPPAEAVAAGKLREDLLYRLNVFPIHMPPLRSRGDDVILLAAAFLGRLNKEAGTAKKLSGAAIDRLLGYSWPGNVRELKNVIHRAFIMARDEIAPDNLFDEGQVAVECSSPNVVLKVGTSLMEAEQRLIDATLGFCEGDKKKTAEVLGISLRTLYYRLNDQKSEDSSESTEARVPPSSRTASS